MSGGLMYDEMFLKHVSAYQHPECPERLTTTWSRLTEAGIVESSQLIKARPAEIEELTRVHDGDYVKRTLERIDGGWGNLDPDTFYSPDSKEAALLAAGGTIDLAHAVWRGEVDWGFALPRPPGHHATERRSMGFCIFNNIAAAAASVLEDGAEKILIFDWDVHHGNGTQDIFYNDPRVMFISVHQWPHYPGSGLLGEVGEGGGTGYTANVPMPAGASDDEYAVVMDKIFDPMVRLFKPDMIMVSAGFDPHEKDMLAGMNLSTDGFAHMAHKIIEAAKSETGKGPCFVLEGGYSLDGLAGAVTAVTQVLGGGPPPTLPGDPDPRYVEVVDSLASVMNKFWPGM